MGTHRKRPTFEEGDGLHPLRAPAHRPAAVLRLVRAARLGHEDGQAAGRLAAHGPNMAKHEMSAPPASSPADAGGKVPTVEQIMRDNKVDRSVAQDMLDAGLY